MAPQLTATKGCAARVLTSWMARATSSLPVPDSPWISTGAMPRATRSISERSCSMAGDSPASRRNAGLTTAGWVAAVAVAEAPTEGNAGTAAWGNARPKAEDTTCRNWRKSTGLVR